MGMWKHFGRRVHGHYLGWTWLCLELGIRLASLGLYFAVRLIDPKIKSVWQDELQSYAYPTRADMISTKMMALYMVLSVCLLPPPLLALRAFKQWSYRQIADDALICMLGVSGAIVMTLLWVELLKRSFSRYRPDFLSRCTGLTDERALATLVAAHTSLAPPPCPPDTNWHTQWLEDGRMSWPSGHSATSFCVYVYLSLWFYVRLSAYKRLGYWKFSFPLIVALFPAFVAITRVTDYRHHYTDVISGALIGAFMGMLGFRFYYALEFPAVFSPELPTTLQDTAAAQQSAQAIRKQSGSVIDWTSGDEQRNEEKNRVRLAAEKYADRQADRPLNTAADAVALPVRSGVQGGNQGIV